MILVDNSTIKPSASREIYQRFHEIGVSALDAPVSGGDIGAKMAHSPSWLVGRQKRLKSDASL